MEGNDMTSGCAGGGGKRGGNSRLLTGLRIRKAYLRRLAVRQDAVPLVCYVGDMRERKRDRMAW